MAIPVVCNDCFYQFQAPDKALGREIKCPECGSIVRISKSEDLIPEAPKVRRGPSKKKTRERTSEENIPSGSGGAVAGIAIGAVLLVAMIVGGVVLLRPDSNEVASVEPAAPEFQIELNNDVVKVDGRIIRDPALATSVRRYADNGPVQLGYTPEKTLFAVNIVGWTQKNRRPDFDLTDLTKGLAMIRRRNMIPNVVFDVLTAEDIKDRREKTFGKPGVDFETIHKHHVDYPKLGVYFTILGYRNDELKLRIDANRVQFDGKDVPNQKFTARLIMSFFLWDSDRLNDSQRNELATLTREAELPRDFPHQMCTVAVTRSGKLAIFNFNRNPGPGIDYSRPEEALEELRQSDVVTEIIFADGSPPLSIASTPGMEHAKLQKEEFRKNTQKNEEPAIDTTVTTSGIVKFVAFGVVTLTLLGIAWFKFHS